MRKNRFAFLSLMLSFLLSISACNGGGKDSETSESQESETSESTSESDSGTESSEEDVKYTVRFIVDGTVVQTSEVYEGDRAEYKGATPVRGADSEHPLGYKFNRWDKDLYDPIIMDTDFNATFLPYSRNIMIDDFEDYSATGYMIDAGWVPLGFSNSTKTWTEDTKAAVSIGYKSQEGKQALRFDAWENGVGYKFARKNLKGTINEAANAIRFRLMVPSINLVKILLYFEAKINGTVQAPYFSYPINVTTGEYVDYTIPLNDSKWDLWSQGKGQSIASVAEWTGINEDVITNYLTRIEFYIEGNDTSIGGNGWPYMAFLDSIEFVTLDNIAYNEVEEMLPISSYTAYLNDGYTFRLDLGEDNTASASVLDSLEPLDIEGTYEINGRNFTFTSNDGGETLVYNGRLVNAGQSIDFKSATGSFKNKIDDVDLLGVQVVNNFEQYDESGTAYYENNKVESSLSGVRGDFYAEYWAGEGSADFGGNGWKLLPNGDEINLMEDSSEAHSGNNYLSLRHRSNNTTRYIQWSLFKGYEAHSFRGSKLSLWVKGFVNDITIRMYSNSGPKLTTLDERVKKNTYSEGKGLTEWKHIELDLNPILIYYGFIISIKEDYLGDADLFIDDIEVYSVDPYTARPGDTPLPDKELNPGMSLLGKVDGLYNANIDILRDNNVKLTVPHKSIDTTGTFEVNENEVTMTFNQTVYVAEFNEDSSKLLFKSITGEDAIAEVLNNLDFTFVDVVENAESYEDAGTMYYTGNTDEAAISGARGAYYCEMETSENTWELMAGGNEVDLDVSTAYKGNQSLRFKRSRDNNYRFIQWDLYKGVARPHTGVDKFNIFFKTKTNHTITLDVYVFTSQRITSVSIQNRVEKEITIPANSEWTRCEIDLDPEETYYGYGIMTHQGDKNAYISADYATFSNVESDPNINFFAKKNLTLNGQFGDEDASIKFDENGVFTFNCAASSMVDVEGQYRMNMTSDGQVITLSFEDTVVKAIYSVSGGAVSFTVIESTGALASSIPVNSVFSNQ